MKKLLWLDDLRIPQQFYDVWAIKGNDVEVIWVKSYEEFTRWITDNGLPDAINFDHDLADEDYTPQEYWSDYAKSKAYQDSRVYKEKTGMECAKWLVEYCLDNSCKLPKYAVHSANPVGADNIRGLLSNFIEVQK